MKTEQPASVGEVETLVRDHRHVRICGGQTKLGARCLSGAPSLGSGDETDDDLCWIQPTRLNQIVEYEPTEFTVTVQAGCTLRDLSQALAEHGQYLPFDPPGETWGATLGGTVASGLSGPGRLRFGGLRDFILGVQLVTGEGIAVRGGGKVVKNAAGFDIPKLMVGSQGWLGCLTEITFKVFPQAPAQQTMRIPVRDDEQALAAIVGLTTRGFDLDALEYVPSGSRSSDSVLWLRLAGEPNAIAAHRPNIESSLALSLQPISESEAESVWSGFQAFSWCPPEHALVKVPVTVHQAPGLLAWCRSEELPVQLSVAGQLAWLAWPSQRAWGELESWLARHELDAAVVRIPTSGLEPPQIRLGRIKSLVFWDKVKQAFDPENRLGDWRA